MGLRFDPSLRHVFICEPQPPLQFDIHTPLAVKSNYTKNQKKKSRNLLTDFRFRQNPMPLTKEIEVQLDTLLSKVASRLDFVVMKYVWIFSRSLLLILNREPGELYMTERIGVRVNMTTN